MSVNHRANPPWPSLNYREWNETYQTLHRWTQIIGKMRLSKTEWTNHSWHSTLYATPVGLTTSPIADGSRSFSIDFDFFSHQLVIVTSEGERRSLPLKQESVADFFSRFKQALQALEIEVQIYPHPNETPDALAFFADTTHASYQSERVQEWWRVMVAADLWLKRFRSTFVGKCSPVHFFWGSFDLAVTRFSGRPAPVHPGGVPNIPDRVVREAYSHEVSSCGFWPGNETYPHAAFYSYAYPEPTGFARARVEPKAAFYHEGLHEFILPFEAIRTSLSPEDDALRFFNSTYRAAADLGGWDRPALETSRFLADLRMSGRSPRKIRKHVTPSSAPT
jgi:hypothetical protein